MRFFDQVKLITVAFLCSEPALATAAPSLSSPVKKLNTAEIMALYEGATVAFNNYIASKSLTDTVISDFKMKAMLGTYVLGDKKKGAFKGKFRLKSDSFFYRIGKRKEVCVSVFTDGDAIS